MKEHFDEDFNIAHLGPNFWRKIIAENPDYCFKSDNCFLFFLDDDGRLLEYIRFEYEDVPRYDAMKACISQEREFDVSALVRLQTQTAYKEDPLGTHSALTEAIYEFADLYNLHFADVVLPRFN